MHDFGNGDELARAIKDSAALNYGLAGPAFVSCLIGRLDEVAETVRVGIDRFAASTLPNDATGQVARACRRLGLIAMAGELAISEGVLPWKRGEAMSAAQSIFTGWVDSRGGSGAAEDTAAIEQVAEFLSTHGASRFEPLHGERLVVIHNRAGFWRDDGLGQREYLIPARTWTNEVCRGLSSQRVAKLLVDRGHLVPDGSGKTSRPDNAPGMGKARFYVVKQSIFGDGDA